MIRPIVHFFRVALTPQGRLLFIAVMLIGVTGLDVDKNRIYLLWSVLAGVLFASLIARRSARLDGVSLSVFAPKRVTVGDSAQFMIEASNRSPRAVDVMHVLGPRLPKGSRWTSARPLIAGLGTTETKRTLATAQFATRGEVSLEGFAAYAPTPLDLALGPPIQSRGQRLFVVPKIAAVKRLRIPETARYQPGGVALASKTGESMELLGVRPYRPGDPVRDLHAKSWARTGTPVIREYQQEYFSRIGIVLDTDGTVTDEAHLEAAISFAAGIVAHVSRGEALIDLLVVGERVHPLTLGRSLGFLEQALDLLACVEPGPKLTPTTLLRRMEPFIGRLSSVVLIALTWDDARRGLEARIRARGVACRSLVIESGRGRDSTSGGPTRISAEAITAGEDLLL